MNSIGKYEREALERRRDELLNKRVSPGLSPWEGKELDDLIAKVGGENNSAGYPFGLPQKGEWK